MSASYRVCRTTVSVLVLVLLVAVPEARAQGDGRARVSGGVAGTVGDFDGAVAISLSGGYMFSKHIGFEVEFVYAPDLVEEVDDLPRIMGGQFPGMSIFPPIEIESEGDATLFLTHLVGELPSGSSRLRPYVLAGGGVGTASRDFDIVGLDAITNLPAWVASMPGMGNGPNRDRGRKFRIPGLERSETAVAASVGGGLDVRIWSGLWIGAEMRYAHLFGGADLDLTRLGGRISYRF